MARMNEKRLEEIIMHVRAREPDGERWNAMREQLGPREDVVTRAGKATQQGYMRDERGSTISRREPFDQPLQARTHGATGREPQHIPYIMGR